MGTRRTALPGTGGSRGGGVCAAMVAAALPVAGWRGLVLGPARLSGRLAWPVVEVLPAGLDRLSAGAGPELDRPTLAMYR